MDSLEHLPLVKKYLRDEGTEFTNYYTTTAMCCPSRVSLWSGQFAHNHNVTDESPPHGSYTKFVSQKLDQDWLPTWLQSAGYSNNYIGKFINGVSPSLKQAPKGFDSAHWEPLVAPNIYTFYSPVFATNNGPLEAHEGVYQTDIISDKSIAILDGLAKNKSTPWLFVISPTAPHDEVWMTPNGTVFTPPVPAKRHEGLFKGAKAPRHPSFNPEKNDKPSWIGTLPRLDEKQVEAIDATYRARLQSLQATDELVERVIKRLEEHGQLENTYIVYTTDNGYHLGTHRMFAGKQTAYEEDTNIPFIIRGPGVAKGQKSNAVATHTHFPATVLKLAGLSLPEALDAHSIPVLENKAVYGKDQPTEAFSVEFWSAAFMENTTARFNTNTYKSVRLIGQGYNLLYTVWCTGEKEYYDLVKDPFQVKNVYKETKPSLLNRLDALLNVLRTCKGPTCRDPWSVIHAQKSEEDTNKKDKDHHKSVKSLKDALNKKYDQFYANLPKFSFKDCLQYYLTENEGTTPPHSEL
ncbi:alkaline-phosphatase-like protein [Gamsiella multidivaricata]|uniref:alkaline-phosphatase-like protein n=1 Tax=Gamsiella multidivaricata TaxID=101098 RepID=UPI002221289A|nr:alkaline-phosphatase-like protein [Gamsiella multidivaricata]KAI7826154.1 alkaline-phosphatase-like protein [Gamsiella multidivaricata]